MYVNNLYEWLAHTEQPAELQPLSLQVWEKKQQASHRAYTAKFDAWSHFCKRASSARGISSKKSRSRGLNTGCFFQGSEDRTPGGSVVTNLDNLKSLMVLLLPQRHVSILTQCHKEQNTGFFNHLLFNRSRQVDLPFRESGAVIWRQCQHRWFCYFSSVTLCTSKFTPVAAEVGRNLVNSAQSKIVS